MGCREGSRTGARARGESCICLPALPQFPRLGGGAFAPPTSLSLPAPQLSLGSSPVPAQLAEGPARAVRCSRASNGRAVFPTEISKQTGKRPARWLAARGLPCPPRPSLSSRRPGLSKGPLGCRPSRRGGEGRGTAQVSPEPRGHGGASGKPRLVHGSQACQGVWQAGRPRCCRALERVCPRGQLKLQQPPTVSWAGANTAPEGLPRRWARNFPAWHSAETSLARATSQHLGEALSFCPGDPLLKSFCLPLTSAR